MLYYDLADALTTGTIYVLPLRDGMIRGPICNEESALMQANCRRNRIIAGIEGEIAAHRQHMASIASPEMAPFYYGSDREMLLGQYERAIANYEREIVRLKELKFELHYA